MSKYDEIKTSFFNERFNEKNSKNYAKPTLATKEEINAFLELISKNKNTNIIELGSGNGRFVLPLLKLGFKITGADVAQDAIDSLQQMAKLNNLDKNLKVVISNFNHKEKNLHGNFDIGYLVSTFYMLAASQEERIKIFKNFLDVIKPGGKIIILDPNPLNPLFYPYYFFHKRVTWAVEKNFLYSNRWNMTKILKDAGLINIEIKPYGLLPGFLLNKWPRIKYINKIGASIPILNYFSTFNFYIGTKK